MVVVVVAESADGDASAFESDAEADLGGEVRVLVGECARSSRSRASLDLKWW
jgi:hypothetical protein